MMSSRHPSGQSSAIRKSRYEGKPSMLPLPRRPGSTDRLSIEARRPSNTGMRSSSADPPRGTFGARLSREASATKMPLHGRPRSQTGESKYGQTTTPLRSSHYGRTTTTPVRTPSEERASRSWQTSLERALAFVTVKDQRPISNAGWQRAASARVSEALAARGQAGALVRPLTIARFVDIAAALLAPLTRDSRLNTDNYVTKLPHVMKRLLYPGAVSKSWLRTVNTLHAFPHALALILYLLDLVTHLEMPVLDEWLYIGHDDLSILRRDYLFKCWIRFQDPSGDFNDLNIEYLHNLKSLLGNDEEKIAELENVIKKYEACLEDETELAARADEARRVERRDGLAAAIRAERATRRALASEAEALRALASQRADTLQAVELELERGSVVAEQLRVELEQQPLSVGARAQLLDQLDYATRVLDSKRALADQIAKLVSNKETELALWQKKTLDSCVEYQQGLIHLTATCPALAALALDEKELMEAECLGRVARAVEQLRAEVARLTARRAELARARSMRTRQRDALLEESRARIAELKLSVEREQQALAAESGGAGAAGAEWARQRELREARLAELALAQPQYARAQADLHYWLQQDARWKTKLASMREYIEQQKLESRQLLENALAKRLQLVRDNLKLWNNKLEC